MPPSQAEKRITDGKKKEWLRNETLKGFHLTPRPRGEVEPPSRFIPL